VVHKSEWDLEERIVDAVLANDMLDRTESAAVVRRMINRAHRKLRAERDEVRAELAALSQWACAECGARFPRLEGPRNLDGVLRCSSCVEREFLRVTTNKLEAERDRLAAENERLQNIIDNAHAYLFNLLSGDDDPDTLDELIQLVERRLAATEEE